MPWYDCTTIGMCVLIVQKKSTYLTHTSIELAPNHARGTLFTTAPIAGWYVRIFADLTTKLLRSPTGNTKIS